MSSHITTNYIRMIGIGSYDIYSQDEEGSLCIDFEKIVPTPKTREEYLASGGAKYKAPEEEGITPVSDRPWFNWLSWTLEHWGTVSQKWPVEIYDDDEIAFDNVYDPPTGIFKAISEMHPHFELDVSSDLSEGNTLNQAWLGGKVIYEELHNDFEDLMEVGA